MCKVNFLPLLNVSVFKAKWLRIASRLNEIKSYSGTWETGRMIKSSKPTTEKKQTKNYTSKILYFERHNHNFDSI